MTSQFSKLPYYDPLCTQLQSLNEFVSPRAVRRYQLEIVLKGSYTLPSPWTGQLLQPLDCYIANISPLGFGDILIAYRFRCEYTFWLISGIVKDGFPINEVFVPAWDCSPWSLFPEQGCERNAVVREQLRQLDDTLKESQPPNKPPVLLLGHPNFAHNLWNELPGLAALEEMSAPGCEGLEIITLYQPILSIEQGFASLGWPHRPIGDVTALWGRQSRIFTRIGATQVSTSLRQKLATSVQRCHDRGVTEPVRQQLQGCFPVVWVTARLDSRTALNQQDMILALVRAIAGAYPRAGFILDGFAYPDDFDNPVYMQHSGTCQQGRRHGEMVDSDPSLGESLVAREHEITPYIARLQQILAHQVCNPVVSTSGLRITDTIFLGGLADYYVCHAGSLQHKIGWTHNSMGIVHSNTTGLGRGAARWMARQVENGVEPVLIDSSLVADLNSIRSINQVERNRDYQFVDIPGVVSQILKDMARRLPDKVLEAPVVRPPGSRSWWGRTWKSWFCRRRGG